jgi:hypothetical protein
MTMQRINCEPIDGSIPKNYFSKELMSPLSEWPEKL